MAPDSAPLAELREALVLRLHEAGQLADSAKACLSEPYSNAPYWADRLTHYRAYRDGIAWAIEEVDRHADITP